MTEVRFYHLTRARLEDVLPGLLQKTVDRGQRAVVQSAIPDRVNALNGYLWTFLPDSFLPHGTVVDGHAAHQPVFLTTTPENPNGADVLFLADGAENADIEAYKLCCDIFDGNDAAAVSAARVRWAALKSKGFTLKYYQQTDRGWEEKTQS